MKRLDKLAAYGYRLKQASDAAVGNPSIPEPASSTAATVGTAKPTVPQRKPLGVRPAPVRTPPDIAPLDEIAHW